MYESSDYKHFKDWLDKVYLPTMRSRLRESCNIVRNTLDELGIRHIIPKAGFYLWMDLIEVQ